MATITVQDPTGAALAAALVRVYRGTTGDVVFSGTTNGSGQVSVTPGAGDYFVHVEPDDPTIAPQFMGSMVAGQGVADIEHAGYWDGTTNITIHLLEDLYLVGEGNMVDRVPYLFWKDTVTSTVLRLAPGEERTRVWDNPQDPIYKHALVGPFLTRAKAAAA